MPDPAHILWAEDSRQDRRLIEESAAGLARPPHLTMLPDGVFLLEALRTTRPDHVVLDLKMPRLGGIEVLGRIRADPAWTALPVTVFSAGDRPEEIARCRALGVVDVVQKPLDFDRFEAAVQHILRSAHPVLGASIDVRA